MKVIENKEDLKLNLEDIYLIIKKSPISINFFDIEDELLTGTVFPGDSIFIKGEGERKPEKVEHVNSHSFENNKLEIKMSTNRDSKVNLIIEDRGKNNINIKINPQSETEYIKVLWSLDSEDHFFGFGERFNKLDQRGEEVDLWVENGCCAGHTYKPIPFFMTPRGYGMVINTTNRCLCRMGRPDDPNYYTLTVMENDFDFNFIYGPSLKGILNEYLEIVGKPEVPEEWVFGAWKSRDWRIENQETVYEDLNIQRELDIPCTVKLIDAGWEEEYHTFKFDEDKYPEYKEMFEKAKKKGYKIVLWISPWVMEGTNAFKRASEADFLLKNDEGETYVTRLGNSPTLTGGVLDFTNPEVQEWWQKKLHKVMNLGAAGFKTDFGEQVPEDAVFSNGKTGKEMHNLYPKLYNELTWEVVREYNGVLLGRSAWHGSQQFPAIWAGDQSQNFDPWKGLPSVVKAGLTAGMSGFPFWTSDIGGYFGEPNDKVFTRWAQFGAFSPIMQIHGLGNHEPWNFKAITLDIYRKYAELHTRLLPYIYTYAEIAGKTGCPIMRALPLEYQDDQQVYELETAEFEYLFGKEMLIAPVYFGGDSRSVYLPEGRWIDWWTGEKYDGNQIVENYSAPLRRIPIFIRSGSIIPLLPEGVETLLSADEWNISSKNEKLVFEIYPDDKSSSFVLKNNQKIEIEKTEEGYKINTGSLEASQIKIKMMDTTKYVISKLEKGKVINTEITRSVLANIDKRAGNNLGFAVNIEPENGSIYLELKRRK